MPKKLLSISLSLILLFHSLPSWSLDSISSDLNSNASQAKHQADRLFESSFSETPALDPEPMPVHLEMSPSQDPGCINSGKPCKVTKEGPPDTPKTSGGDSDKGSGTCINCGGSNSTWNPKDGDEAFIDIYEGLGKVAAGGAMVLAMMKGLAIATKEVYLSSWSWGLITTIGLAGLGILLFSSLLGPMTFGLFQTLFTFGFLKTPSKDKNHPERRALWFLGYLTAKAASVLFLLNTLGLMGLPFSLPFNLPGLSTGLGKTLAGYSGLQVLEMPISLMKHLIKKNKSASPSRTPGGSSGEDYGSQSSSPFQDSSASIQTPSSQQEPQPKTASAPTLTEQEMKALDQKRTELTQDMTSGHYKPGRIRYVNGAALLEETCDIEGNCQPNNQGSDKRFPNDRTAINKLLKTGDFVKEIPFTLWTPPPPAGKDRNNPATSETQTTSGFLRERRASNNSLYHHAGLDIQTPRGAAVVSATGGKVLFAGYYQTGESLKSTDEETQRKSDITTGLGNVIVLQPEGETTRLNVFQHLGEKSEIKTGIIATVNGDQWTALTTEGEKRVKHDEIVGPIDGKDCRHGMDQNCESGIYVYPGQTVKPGDPLGKVGNTGKIYGHPSRGQETGAHLHWGTIEVHPEKNDRMRALKNGTGDKSVCEAEGKACSPVQQQQRYYDIRQAYFLAIGYPNYDQKTNEPTGTPPIQPNTDAIRHFIARATMPGEKSLGAAFMNPWLSRVEQPEHRDQKP
ncbi:MAG: hypothetical protein HY401_10320 [Elusimicrobia bacterium]|nr:hypothetical protein [Elusimicrobiota bacterium]